ncbi:hypothetical protein [Parabacteroides sp. Marseille-P3160]|uniref:hypothetical protein n=1 Tax=Parabacteroides sp. Marseille-P3160 TaxID=1917887 RepID=UPI0011187D65|nr:hypothetical protein [Parabacteroides sp. Marseille-P3160]
MRINEISKETGVSKSAVIRMMVGLGLERVTDKEGYTTNDGKRYASEEAKHQQENTCLKKGGGDFISKLSPS